MKGLSILTVAIMFVLTGAQAQEVSDDAAENLQLSCGAARNLLVREGYRDIIVRSCFTNDYAFTANRDGKARKVYVDPQNGRVWEG